jgi:phosphatidylglycerophosphate synthase
MILTRLPLADLITLSRWALTPFFWYTALMNQWTSALAIWVLIWLTDMVDGTVARWQGTVSVRGALLDTIIDKIIVLSCCWVIPLDMTLSMLILGKECVQGLMLAYVYRQGRRIAPVSLWAGKLTMVVTWLYITARMAMYAGLMTIAPVWMSFLWVLIIMGYIYSLITYGRVWFS